MIGLLALTIGTQVGMSVVQGVIDAGSARSNVEAACQTYSNTQNSLRDMQHNLDVLSGSVTATQIQIQDQIGTLKDSNVYAENWLQSRAKAFRIKLILTIITGLITCIGAAYIITSRSSVLESKLGIK
jgi:septation ring formation regulator EzrA